MEKGKDHTMDFPDKGKVETIDFWEVKENVFIVDPYLAFTKFA